jgi:hypothetical protein
MEEQSDNRKADLVRMFDAVRLARCPECGDHVFIPTLHFPPKSYEDPIVWCREFGHWAGYLSECNREVT